MTGAHSNLRRELGGLLAAGVSMFTLGAAAMLWLSARVVVEALRFALLGVAA